MTGGVTGTHKVQVEWGDCDPAQIVFYPNYFRWFDQATWRLFVQVGLTRPVLQDRYGVIGYPLVKADSEFLRSAIPGDVLTVESRIERWGGKSFSLHHIVRNPDGQIGAIGHETRVWARQRDDGPGLQSVEIPAEVKALFGA